VQRGFRGRRSASPGATNRCRENVRSAVDVQLADRGGDACGTPHLPWALDATRAQPDGARNVLCLNFPSVSVGTRRPSRAGATNVGPSRSSRSALGAKQAVAAGSAASAIG
jgi:hypothetical protein